VFGPRTKYSESMRIYPNIFQAEIHAIERLALTTAIARRILPGQAGLPGVPRHRRIGGNKKADILANKDLFPFTGPKPFCSLGNHTCKHELKMKEEHERSKLWEQLTGSRVCKIEQKKSTLTHRFTLRRLSFKRSPEPDRPKKTRRLQFLL